MRELGQTVNQKTVQPLMVETGLKSLVRPKKSLLIKVRPGARLRI
ncbi:MAG: hypothetical protein ACK4QP_12695 [Pseudorhizobium sp.]